MCLYPGISAPSQISAWVFMCVTMVPLLSVSDSDHCHSDRVTVFTVFSVFFPVCAAARSQQDVSC